MKRLWGYLDEGVSTRQSTLLTLSQFLGYKDWEDFQQKAGQPQERQSSPIMSRRLSVSSLHPTQKLKLLWQPGRICIVEYHGDLNFRVLESVNTRLQPGDTFQCSIIVEGEPLYIDNLCQKGNAPIAYVCGKRSGVLFEII